jgi:acetyl esterase/lipase
MVKARVVAGLVALAGLVAGLDAGVPMMQGAAVAQGVPGTVPGTRSPGTLPPDPPAPTGTITLDHRGSVPSGSVVGVRVEGADPAAGPVPVSLCGGDAGRARQCKLLGSVVIGADGRGGRQIYAETPAFVVGGPPIDCRATACEVQAGDDPTNVAPITFARESGTRYADRVFADVEVTSGLVYGRAPSIVPLDPLQDTYGESAPQDLLLDLYEPRGDTLAERPVVVYVHGGYFSPTAGYDRTTAVEAVRFANDWTRRGYVVAAIDYRVIDGPNNSGPRLAKAVPAAHHDAQAAVRWLRANAARYRLSTSAIGMAGYSAGATTALQVGYFPRDVGDSGTSDQPSDIAATVSMAGALATPEVVGVNNYPPYAEPLRAGPPVLMFHSTTDEIIPYAWSVKTRDVIARTGSRCDLITYEGLRHVFLPEKDYDVMPRTIRFLAATLVPALDGAATAVAAQPVAAAPRYTG